MKIATLIDADTIIFLVAYNHRDKNDVDVVNYEVDKFVKLILDNTHCSHYLGFLGGEQCFRHSIYDLYKSKRAEKPDWFRKWEGIIRLRLIDTWGFIVCDGIEAEDGAIITAEKYRNEYNLVLAHVDKDLNFWEGNHYNYSKHKFWYSSRLGTLELDRKGKIVGNGLKFMYAQIICGDPTDCIPGLKGKGAKFADMILDTDSEYALFRRTYAAYLKHHRGSNPKEYFKQQASLVCMLDKEAYGFTVPKLIERETNDTNIDTLFT